MTAFATPSPATDRTASAERLWHAAAIVLALMPLGMAIAHRSAPLFLGISTALVVAAAMAERSLGLLVERLHKVLWGPLGWAGLAFFAWALLSIGWSAFPATSWRAFVEFWLAVGAALIVSVALPARAPRSTFLVLAVSTGLACVLILFELHTGLSIRQSLGVTAFGFIFNRPTLTVLVLAIPLFAWLCSSDGRPIAALAGALSVLIPVLIVASDSGAAALGLVVAAASLGLAWIWPRVALGAAACAVVLSFAVAPVQGELAERTLPPEVYARLAGSHSRERVDLWRSFGAAIERQPWLGGGFGVSPQMRRTKVARQVPRELRRMLRIGHPHNAAMQVWTELGAVGAVLAVAVLLLTLHSMRRLPVPRLAPGLALMGAAAAASLVGHGAWQGWWAAAVGAAIVWLRMANQGTQDTA